MKGRKSGPAARTSQGCRPYGLRTSALAARGMHVIAYDARGHGRSGYTTVAGDYEKTALAGDLLGLMDALGLPRASIYGTSMGATTALLLALAHPERVERLVVRSPSPFGDDMSLARRALGGLALSYQLLGVSVTSRLAAMMPGTGDPVRTRALLRDQRRAAIVPALRGFLSAPLGTQHLDEIVAPTLVLTHRGDPVHPLRSGDILYDRMPDVTG
ncbi:MAG: alpha/beta hydrolase [Vicinamibacteraceae bacterium]